MTRVKGQNLPWLFNGISICCHELKIKKKINKNSMNFNHIDDIINFKDANILNH